MWSKLQKQIENLFIPELQLRVHCAVYRHKTQHSELNLPRYFFQLGDKIIWDYPKDFVNGKNFCLKSELQDKVKDFIARYPYDSSLVRNVSDKFREYINCPKEELLTHDFQDILGITNLLKIADRRISAKNVADIMFSHLDDHDAISKLYYARVKRFD